MRSLKLYKFGSCSGSVHNVAYKTILKKEERMIHEVRKNAKIELPRSVESTVDVKRIPAPFGGG